jgi:N-acetylglucosamine transport system permease protein
MSKAFSAASPLTRGQKLFFYSALGLLALVVIYPMFWLLASSLKSSWQIFQKPWGLPHGANWINYRHAWTKGALGTNLWNSIVIDFSALVLILLFSLPAAYALGRFAFTGARFLRSYFIAGLALPVFLGIVPLFLLLSKVGIPGTSHVLLGSRLGVVLVYAAYSLSFTIFVMTGFYRGLPGELAEAAVVDGCSPFSIFSRIMLPLSKPGITTASIFVFIGLWNEYPLALVLLPTEAVQTLPIGIANLTTTQKYQADWGALFAGLVIAIVPAVLIFAVFQKQIQAGLTAGAVKG